MSEGLRRSNGTVNETAHLKTNQKKFNDGWDRIFGNKYKVPEKVKTIDKMSEVTITIRCNADDIENEIETIECAISDDTKIDVGIIYDL